MAKKSVWFLFPVFVSITQFFDFWVMSYANWKHILSIFSFQNSVSNDILVIKHTLRDSRSEQQPQHLTFFFSLGSVNFPFTLASSSFSFLFSHNLFSNTQTQTHKHFHPHKPTKWKQTKPTKIKLRNLNIWSSRSTQNLTSRSFFPTQN